MPINRHPALERQPREPHATNCCHGEGNQELDDIWGDAPHAKSPSTIRLAFQNIQGLPRFPHSEKHQQIISLFDELQLDSFGIAEVNLNLPRLPSSQQWRERFKGLKSSYTICSTNTHTSCRESVLFGGVAQLTTGTLAHRAIENGADPSGLGRWVWTRHIGRHGTSLRIITGYRPVPNSHSDGPWQVANQHEAYLLAHDDDRDARTAFLADLHLSMITWIASGDSIILQLDANEHVRQGEVVRYTQQWGLVDVHHRLHPHIPTVATCSKNRSQTPIDGIWASASIDILAAGYSGFGEYPIGHADHRLLWFDVAAHSCFGFTPPKPAYRQPRRLTLSDPRVVKKYNNLLMAEHHRHHLPQRASRLYEKIPLTDIDDQLEYENIATLDAQCRRHADRRCRKLRMGQIPFSDELKRADSAVQLWLLMKKKRQGNRASTAKIRRLMQQLDIPTAFEASPSDIVHALTTARQQYKTVKKNATTHRKKFQTQLIKAQARLRGISENSQRRSSIHTEQQRTTARRVKQVLGRDTRTSFKMLDAPDLNGTRRICQDRASIEQACQTEGLRRFTQASHTPFLQDPILTDVGLLANTPMAEAILEGTYDPVSLHDKPILRKFIAELRRDPSLPDLETGFLSSDAHRKGWTRMKSTTSASPFGPGFIDYIASCRHAILSEFDATMSSIPFMSGYAPLAWSKATDVMIPKKADSISVEKLRIIVLFHALFNQANKSIGRLLTRHAELYNQIPWEAFGSRRHHRASECALNKVLTTDIWRQTRRCGALCSNDAKSCYDRIAHNIAILCMRRLGLSPETCHVMIGTLQQVQHHVRTTYGDSASSYCGIEIPIHGIGQGNGAGPAIWLVVSIPIINMLKTQGFGFIMQTPITRQDFSFVCYTFVDDTDLAHSPTDTTTAQQIITDMQQILEHWEGGLRATGGALVPSKSYWYLIDFRWQKDRWHYTTIADNPGNLHILDEDLSPTTLERLEVTEARETLGVYIAMNGNQTAQFQKLRDIATRWADQVRCGRLNTIEAWFSLNHSVMKALEYPLLTTSLTRHQCDTIMQKLLTAALPKLHIAISFPKVARFGPRRYHGLGISHLWTTQGIEKLWAAYRHGDADTIPGYQIRCSLELAMLEVGVPTLLSQPFKRFHKLITPGWLSSLWEFVDCYHFTLRDNTPPIPLQCIHDQFLISAFEELQLADSVLRQANVCRQWLKVLRVSDIASGDGTRILLQYWQGTSPSEVTKHYNWPINGVPSAAAWHSWRLALSGISQGPMHTLIQPLGEWSVLPQSDQDWFYAPTENRLYKILTEQIQVFLPTNGRATRRPRFQYNHSIPRGPLHAIRTSVIICSPMIVQHTGTRPTVIPAQPINNHWAVERLSIPLDIQLVISAIQEGNAFGLCDGSYKAHHGTAAFVLQANSDPSHRILGCNRTAGDPKDQSSFRSELGGILGLTILLRDLCSRHDITEGGIEIACDCLSALTTVFVDEWDDPQQSCFDLIHQIRHEIQHSPLLWTWRHIRGHQDKHTQFAALDWRSQLNVEMDSLAKAYWNTTYDMTAPFPATDSSTWQLSHGTYQFTCLDRKLIYELCHGPPLQQFWRRKLDISAIAINTINWDICEDGLRRLDINKRLWLSKMTTNTAPTGQILHRRGHLENPICPRCGLYEDTTHIVCCLQPEATVLWQRRVIVLSQWLTRHSTAPDLQELLLQSLQNWRANPTNPATPALLAPELSECYHSQAAIGWNAFLYGFASNHWSILQQAYFDSIHSRRTGLRWSCSLFSEVLKIPWHLWRHRCDLLPLASSYTTQDEHHRLNALIQAEYDTGTLGWRDRDRRWFQRPPDDIFDEPLPYKTAWLQSVSITRERHTRRLLNPHAQEQQVMHLFLHPPPH